MIKILHQDDSLIAIAKPSGLLVHKTALASDRETCMTLLRDQIGEWVYPVHRLDRGASGVLLFARNPDSARSLGEQFRLNMVEKRYLAVVRGYFPGTLRLEYPLREEDKDSRGDTEPQQAITEFVPLATMELPTQVGRYWSARYSLVDAYPHTGRRHQIRRHLAHLRHPIIGDAVHGDGKQNRFFRETFGFSRLALHALRICLCHPQTGKALTVEAPPAEDVAELIERLQFTYDR